MRERLLEALTYINDELKQQVVVQLASIGGQDVGDAFCNLLMKRGDFAGHVRDELVLTLCTKIKLEPSKRAIEVVKELLAERLQHFDEEDPILQAAQDALESMDLKNSDKVILESRHSVSLAAPPASEASKVPVVTVEEFDSLLNWDEVIAQEEPDPPQESSTVSEKEESPTDTDQSTLSGKEEIIEKAANNLADSGSAAHFTIWAKLYEEMTTEEFIAFHKALKLKTYQPNELIIAHGDLRAPLFFLNSGTVNLVRNLAGEKVQLSAIGAGDLIGSDIFLTGEAWNLSLYAGEDAQAHVFDLEHLLKMQIDFPHLAEKLFTFCSRHDVLQNLLRVLDDPAAAGTDSTRIQIEDGVDKSAIGKIEQGVILRKLKGGLCFSLPVKNSEKLNIPLETQLSLSVRLSSGVADFLPATIVGTTRSVAMPGESAVFVRFLLPLPDAQYSCENIEILDSE